jgi:hypothetical protein
MHATIRRYEGVDQNRTEELTKKVGESLVPKLSKLEGFSEYYLIEAGNGIITSVGIFDTPTHASESTRIAADWIREENLESALPNPPKVTEGEIIAHKNTASVLV